MSKSLNQVMNYANEDEVSIYKHWIVFLRAGIGSVITSFVLFFVGFMIARTRFRVWGGMLVLMLVITAYRFFKAYSEYKTTVLTINNIRLYGETGLASVGGVNWPIEKVESASYSSSFWGR